MEIEKIEMAKWFQNLLDENKKILTYVSRIYSYHFDVYLNNIYRRKIFPRKQLLTHANELITDPNEHNMWVTYNHTDKEFDNKFCKEYPHEKSPFQMFLGKKKIKLSEYIETIKNITKHMHEILSNPDFSYVLQNDIVVYRALRLKKKLDEKINIEKDIITEFIGATSTTTKLESAQQFAFSLYGESEHYDERYNKSIIFELTLPKGTRVIPLNICTIQDEDEILVISQGNMKIDNIEYDVCKWWNDYYNEKGVLIGANKRGIPYLLAKSTFTPSEKKLEYVSDIKISEKIENKFSEIVEDNIDGSKRKSTKRSKRKSTKRSKRKSTKRSKRKSTKRSKRK
jgi:hypothetical protein